MSTMPTAAASTTLTTATPGRALSVARGEAGVLQQARRR